MSLVDTQSRGKYRSIILLLMGMKNVESGRKAGVDLWATARMSGRWLTTAILGVLLLVCSGVLVLIYIAHILYNVFI